MNVYEQYKIMEFDEHGDERGKLIVIEGGQDIPFEVKRVFCIYGTDGAMVRGRHANRNSEFVLISVSGSVKIKVDDGFSSTVIHLNKPRMGVYLPTMLWREMYDFSADAVLLVLSDEHYDDSEYIRNYEEYVREIRTEKH